MTKQSTSEKASRLVSTATVIAIIATFISVSTAFAAGQTINPEAYYYFRVMWNGEDASQTATVGWSSNADPGTDQKLYFDTVDHGKDQTKYSYTQNVDAKNYNYDMYNNFVRLKNLRPKTKYYFVVAGKAGVSSRYWFETASDNPADRMAVITGGDSRNNREPRRNANLLVSKLRPHAVFFGGDMTASGSTSQWKEWFEDWQLTVSSDGRITPVVMTRGNHEKNNEILVNLFDTPKGVYYRVSMGGNLLNIYTLNSESSIGGAQTEWLKNDLAQSTDTIWKIAQYHRPMRPHVRSKSEGDNQYKYWAGLFYQYNVNLVVESDAHTVKSTWPLKPSAAKGNDQGFIRDDQRGTVYIGEGCWGAPLRTNDDNKSWTRDSAKFNHFNWVFLDQQKMEIRTIKVDNAPQVASLEDSTRFSIPKNLQIWKPTNGDVITITK